MESKKLKIIFAGAVQNCANYLPLVLKNIEEISSIASESSYIFVENDSKDKTKSVLNNWGSKKDNFRLINLDGLNKIPIRGLRLEYARNTYLEIIKNNKILSNYDFLFVMDMDDASKYPIDKKVIKKGLNFLNSTVENAAIFANQIGTYYDMWTIRHSKYCPNDVWEEVFDYARINEVSDEEAYKNTFAKKLISFSKDLPPIEVNSAFGGLGIYKLKFVVNNLNPYLGSKIKILDSKKTIEKICRWQVCEHVHFNYGIKAQGGKMFIYPELVNGQNEGLSFSPNFYKSCIFG